MTTCGLCGEPWTAEHSDQGVEHYALEAEVDRLRAERDSAIEALESIQFIVEQHRSYGDR